jgi:hypothetical protein
MKRRKSYRKKRPVAVGVIVIAIGVLFLVRLYQVVSPLVQGQGIRMGMTGPLLSGWRLTALGSTLLTSLTYLLLSIAGIIVLIGLLRLRSWSWVVLMAWTAVSLIISLVNYFYSQANYLVMACDVVIAFALNLPDIRRIFKIRRENGQLGS